VVVKNAVFCKSGDKAPKKHKKLTESGGKTSKFGQNLPNPIKIDIRKTLP